MSFGRNLGILAIVRVCLLLLYYELHLEGKAHNQHLHGSFDDA